MTLSNVQRQLQGLQDMVARGTQFNPGGRLRPYQVTSPTQATTVIIPMWPPTSSHYIPRSFRT